MAAAHNHPWKISDVVLFPALIPAIALEWLWPSYIGMLPSSWLIPIGIIVAALGGGLIVWAKRTLSAADQPSLPGHETTRLITSGAFRISRNPNYLGGVTIWLGCGLAFNSLWFLAVGLLCAAALEVWMIRPEERYLQATFGAEYEAFRRRTRRWI